jgi:hypothetical protein
MIVPLASNVLTLIAIPLPIPRVGRQMVAQNSIFVQYGNHPISGWNAARKRKGPLSPAALPS